MAKPVFTKKVAGELNNDIPPSQMNIYNGVADINQDRHTDLVVCGINGTIAWFENKGDGETFEKHVIDEMNGRSCGAELVDLTGNGYPDLIIGADYQSNEIYWWENPGVPDKRWEKKLLYKMPFNKCHDIAIADIKNNGEKGLIISNQYSKDNAGTTLIYIPVPDDPYVSPWPGAEIIASGKYENNPKYRRKNRKQPEEGIAVGDIDGDGRNELVAGTWWYKYTSEKGWEEHKFAKGYITTKISIADIDGDGVNEIVLSEGDPCIFGHPEGGKLGWFKPEGDITDYWKEHRVDTFLLDAHSLCTGDLCGNGKPDILVGECGRRTMEDRMVFEGRLPKVMVYENDGKGNFTRHVIDEGTGAHDAILVDMKNRGVLDIYAKPIFGPEMWNIHIWYNNL